MQLSSIHTVTFFTGAMNFPTVLYMGNHVFFRKIFAFSCSCVVCQGLQRAYKIHSKSTGLIAFSRTDKAQVVNLATISSFQLSLCKQKKIFQFMNELIIEFSTGFQVHYQVSSCSYCTSISQCKSTTKASNLTFNSISLVSVIQY